MQIPIIAPRGQNRPHGSIPRINWNHPLSRGLMFYGYDTGSAIIDLVDGRTFSVTGSGTAPSSSSRYGSAHKYTSGGIGYRSVADARFDAAIASNLFSVATGWLITALPSVVFTCPFGINNTAAGGSTWASILWDSVASDDVMFSVGDDGVQFGGLNSVNVYHTAVGVNSAATAQTLYFDGKSAGTSTKTNSGPTGAEADFNNIAGLGFEGVAGFVFYGAFWRRTLSANEAAQLHFDPYCFLIYPEDEMFAALVGAAAAGFSVTADFGGAIELLAGVRSDSGDLLEWLASVRADRPLQLEALAAVRFDYACAPEFVAGLCASTAAQLECLGSLRSDGLGPVEMIAALRADIVMLSEVLSGRRSDAGAAAEILAALRADLIGHVENLGGVVVVANSVVPLEALAKLTADYADTAESVVSARSDQAAATEGLAGVASQASTMAEGLAVVQANAPAQVESLGGIAVVANAATPIEALTRVTSDRAVSAEAGAAMRSDQAAAGESLAGVVRQAASPVETLAAVQGNAAPPVEALGGVAVVANAAVPIEAIGKVTADKVAGAEGLASVARQAGAGLEHVAGQSSNAGGPVRLEFTSGLAAFGMAVVEIVRAVVGFVLSPRFARASSEQRSASTSAAERLVQPREAARRVIVPGEGRDTTPEG